MKIPYYKTNNCQLFRSDNLELLKQLPDNHINLIYCDILYGTGKTFSDYKDLKAGKKEINDHYLPRIKEMFRVLNDDGTMYLQMDYNISHWIRVICEDLGFLLVNEIVWKYGLGNNNKKRNWQDKHDTILMFSKSKGYIWNDDRGNVTPQMKAKYCHTDEIGKYMISYGKKYYLKGGKRSSNVWDIANLSATSKERIGYDTQKPKELIEKIINASSNKNDLIADFYMGSGTTAEVALETGRRFIGCDIGEKACLIAEQRVSKYE